MKFCRALVLKNTTYYWATASDFQQHLWRIACFISNISIQSQLVVQELHMQAIHIISPEYV